MIDPEEDYPELLALLDEAASYLKWSEEDLFDVTPAVSGWSIAQHLHHITLANRSVPKLIARMKSGALGEADKEQRPDMIELIERGILPSGFQAPARVVPPFDLDYAMLETDFNKMREAIEQLDPLLEELEDIPLTFPHLYFGPLNAVQWLRFMCIHTQHHLDIINEIAG